jgi:glutamate dehydrogenase
VVAADKGTATFSDIANEVAASYGFWLGDAFASGGSDGYDHKAMAITARGAWESVRRHFRVLGRDADTESLTVVGVGDMSGDVFGNGMLLSSNLRLVAAFDHRDIFLDPDPDPAVQAAERRRLFETPRSTWQSYDRSLLSPGGGVYARSAKSIPLTPEVRARLGIDAEALSPPELMRAILCAPVDLFWNGGIGTYVKASTERHADVGDRANDAIRVDGRDLRCLVVGEGGNLGFTQPGRVEAALRGVMLNTDAIDNSAGVDCSDHEVNLKILLDTVVAEGDLTTKQRNELLVAMTDDVAALVLADNVDQNVALAVARSQAAPMVDVHTRYVRSLEQEGLIDRELEHLPSEQEFDQRQAAGLGLTTPEFAVLLAYTKTTDIAEVLRSDLPDDPAVQRELSDYFPPLLVARYGDRMGRHPLRREIVANRLVNHMVNAAGTSFDHRMMEETGATVPDIVRAHEVSRRVLGLDRQWDEVLALDGTVPADVQLELFIELRRMVERGVLWLLRHRRSPIDIAGTEAAFAPGFAELSDGLVGLVSGARGADLRAVAERYEWVHVPADLAVRAAAWPLLHTGFDLVEVANARGRPPRDAAAAYWELFERLDLRWVWDRVGQLPRIDRWQTHARAAMRDDLLSELRQLTDASLRSGDVFTPPAEAVQRWLVANRRPVERLARVFAEIRAGGTFDLTTISVALRQLRNLAAR